MIESNHTKITEIVGKTKLSEAMPLLKTIAEKNNLSLCTTKGFLTAKDILIKKIETIYGKQF